MGALKAIDNVYYVGVLDKKIRVFDIVMQTEYGTTYNSYIIRGSEKTVLVETSKDKFCEEYFKNIEEICPLEDIDYIVCSHTEPDHSGCLQRVLKRATKAVVLASGTAITFLKEIINEPFPHKAMADGDSIDIGGMTLQFMYMPMLHWPDTMFTYVPEIKALFSCDVFGCHYADDNVFNDKMDMGSDFLPAYKYYFDNILGPYVHPHLDKALAKIKSLPIEFIGNGHGPVLRSDIPKYIEMYENWSKPVQTCAKQVTIVYVSAYGYTAALAREIEKGLKEGGIEEVLMYDLVTDSMDEARTAILRSDGFLLGSPTLVGDALPPIYEVMIGLNPVVHRGKFAAAFGSYGWSGEAVHNITTRLQDLRFNLPLPGMRVRLKPTEDQLAQAQKFGEDFAKEMMGTCEDK